MVPVSPAPTGLSSLLVASAIHTMLAAISSAVDGAAAAALRLTGSMLSSTTSPGLLSTWFSATYWRVAALSALLTVPFLFAAAIHALVRSDLALLGRAAFGYLPLAMIGVTIAAPLTTLVLSATDEMCAVVANAAGQGDGAALARAATGVAALSAASGSPMLAFFVGLFAVVATIGLWIELLIRAAAVDVIVLMLPLFFAAMVWPARRIWAVRAIETLVALILSKFAIVAVLTLGGAAIGSGSAGLTSSLVGATLVVLSVLSPWALLRLLPLHEVAAATAGGLSQAPHDVLRRSGNRLMSLAGAGIDGAWPEEPSGAPGLGPEDGTADMVPRAAGFGAGGARQGRGGGGGGGGRSPRGPRLGPGDGDPEVQDGGGPDGGGGGTHTGGDGPGPDGGGPALDDGPGLAALGLAGLGLGAPGRDDGAPEGADGGDGPAGDEWPPFGASAEAIDRRPGDGRGPIPEVFGPQPWAEPFVLGEEGGDRMGPPRLAPPADEDGGRR